MYVGPECFQLYYAGVRQQKLFMYLLMLYYTNMDALRSIGNSSFEQQQEKATLKTDGVDEKYNSLDSTPEKGKTKPEQEINAVNKNDDERINISISRKAYDAVEKYTKELNERESNNQKPFTIEEVLDEEIIFLFSDEWRKE